MIKDILTQDEIIDNEKDIPYKIGSFFKKHWHSMLIIVIASVIFYQEYHAVSPYKRWIPSSIENPFFIATGTWGLRFLLVSLLMSPIYTLTGWRLPLKFRKPLGLAAFAIVSVHVGIHLFTKWQVKAEMTLLQRLVEHSFVIYGVIAFVILALMAVTSVKLTMKLMGRYWKPLHRLVYVAGLLVMVHSMTAIAMSKRGFMPEGQEAYAELQIYLGILIFALVMRIPLVKDGIQAINPLTRRKRKSKPKRS